MENVDVPNIINRRQAVFFDVLCEHDPPGTEPGERADSAVFVQCWVNHIAAFDPEEAGRKAERFLVETKGVRNIRVTRWRFFNSRRQSEGVKSDGKLFA